MGVLDGAHAVQRQRTGARAHAVGAGDIVLQEHGNAVQRAAQLAGGAFAVHLGGDLERVRIGFDD
jgi:hypothetical protein